MWSGNLTVRGTVVDMADTTPPPLDRLVGSEPAASVGPDPEAPRRSGRPRGPSSATEYAVLSTAWRILTEEGITALTPTRLHAETGVARTTIYRHWPDASAVVADIVAGASARRVPMVGSGDVRADLLAALESLTFRLRHRPVAPLLAALLAGAAQADAGSPTPADYIGALIAPLRDAIGEGIERGVLVPGRSVATAPTNEIDALLHDLVGPLLLDVLLLGGDPQAIDDERVIDRFLDRHRPRPATPAPPMLQPDVDESTSTAAPTVFDDLR